MVALQSNHRYHTEQPASMSEMDIYHPTRDIFLYFDFPFDVPLPKEFCAKFIACFSFALDIKSDQK